MPGATAVTTKSSGEVSSERPLQNVVTSSAIDALTDCAGNR